MFTVGNYYADNRNNDSDSDGFVALMILWWFPKQVQFSG